MKRWVFAIILVIAGIAALGYWQGWYTFSKTGDEHKDIIEINVNRDKIQEDKEKAKKKVEELETKAKEKANEAGDKVKKESDQP
jgi:hypothetical protein